MIIESRAYARAGLLGNPSDGYFGKTISIIVRNFGAHVSLYETPEMCIEPLEQDRNIFRNIYHFLDSVQLTGYYGGDRLVKAAIKKFCEYCEQSGIRLHNRNFTIRYRSTIPRQIGLAGSSAIITATLRALMQFYQVQIPMEVQPGIVLAAEKEELGINAGLQDRVIQVYEGCVFMDFDRAYMEEHGFGRYERLDPTRLPNLYIAYRVDLGKVSGAVLNDIRTKYDQGDRMVTETLAEIAGLAERGRRALLKGDFTAIHRLMNRNFDLRSRIMRISDSNRELVERARASGASAKFTGSGGSIIGMYENEDVLKSLIIEMQRIKARVIKPFIS
jgi:glucuronokinase